MTEVFVRFLQFQLANEATIASFHDTYNLFLINQPPIPCRVAIEGVSV